MNKEERERYVLAQLRSLPNSFQYVEVINYINLLKEENTNLKQALNEIREYINSEKFFIRMDEPQISVGGVTKYELVKDDILQIIDKALGGNNE